MSDRTGKCMFQMKVTPSPTNPSENILEIKVTAPKAPETFEAPDHKIPTFIYIDDSIEQDQLPQITHAITDTINRITWPDQIQIVTSKKELPDHLPTIKIEPQEIFQKIQELEQAELLVITNTQDPNFKREAAKASEFLVKTEFIQPTTTFELIDNLNDHIKHLKQKTIVNLKLEIELPNVHDTLEPLTYIPQITKKGNKYFANLIDLASEEDKAYAFKVSSPVTKVKFSYDDLLLSRHVSGGQNLTH